MAAHMKNFLVARQNLWVHCRWASQAIRNQKTLNKGQHRGWKKWDGEWVEKGDIIFKQLGLKRYPGLNVFCDSHLSLVAMEPGRVMLTVETLSPYPDSPLYAPVKRGRVVRKFFYHVIPEPQKQDFKLVSLT